MVVGLLEQTEELEVGVAEMAVELGASARLSYAGVGVPAACVTIEELIFANAFPTIVQINILKEE